VDVRRKEWNGGASGGKAAAGKGARERYMLDKTAITPEKGTGVREGGSTFKSVGLLPRERRVVSVGNYGGNRAKRARGEQRTRNTPDQTYPTLGDPTEAHRHKGKDEEKGYSRESMQADRNKKGGEGVGGGRGRGGR
jgi:hypothetical protein